MQPIILHRRSQDENSAILAPSPKEPANTKDLSIPRSSKPQSQRGDFFAKVLFDIRHMTYIHVLEED